MQYNISTIQLRVLMLSVSKNDISCTCAIICAICNLSPHRAAFTLHLVLTPAFWTKEIGYLFVIREVLYFIVTTTRAIHIIAYPCLRQHPSNLRVPCLNTNPSLFTPFFAIGLFYGDNSPQQSHKFSAYPIPTQPPGLSTS